MSEVMSSELFEIFCMTAADYNVNVRTDYSGRGMYGRQCVGLDGNFGDIQRVMASVQLECVENDFDNTNLVQEFTDFCWYFEMDSMGLGSIVYWRNIEAPENADEILERYFPEDDYYDED